MGCGTKTQPIPSFFFLSLFLSNTYTTYIQSINQSINPCFLLFCLCYRSFPYIFPKLETTNMFPKLAINVFLPCSSSSSSLASRWICFSYLGWFFSFSFSRTLLYMSGGGVIFGPFFYGIILGLKERGCSIQF